MLIDARHIPSGRIIDTEVCIVGAGPAGIAIARELNGQDFRVYLLETGGFEANPENQNLAEDAGLPIGDASYPRACYTRERIFGGTSTVWPIDIGNGNKGVRYVPLDSIDFEKRDWVPYSGWPIDKNDLDPYYQRAHRVCQSGPYDYRVSTWEDETAQQILFPDRRLRTQIFQFGPRDIFSQDYRQELEASKTINLCTHATVLELETNDLAQTVTQVRVGTLTGNQFWVKAKFVILAVGGLEAPRLLLLSNRIQQAGLGNDNDLVGRFLMDHQGVRSGLLTPPDRRIINSLSLYDTRVVNGAMVTAKAVFTEETMRREKLLNICAAFYPRPARDTFNLLRTLLPQGMRYRSPAVESARVLKHAIKNRQLPDNLLSHLTNLATGLDDLIYAQWRKGYNARKNRTYHFDKGGWSRVENPAKQFACFEIVHFTEQSPDPTNRVTLSREKDPLGGRKLQIHWRLNDLDLLSIRKAQSLFVEEFDRVGLGRLTLELDRGAPQFFTSSIHHPMGTTRMHDNPQEGVVDAQCKVHGISNLYIAGSSVFPTGGFANPTLTIMALALRVADQIKVNMAQRSTVIH